ncbi:hypothetical protein [Sphingobium phenoxybenzoativorans]|uniref:hypothetical protein n=1 Tax=Sphingobium phenoxybenzoativorans TaxID=1592790 RepID=UPI0008730FC5|nr:hypothetical protein [Sphingobium phenoxybenzoativorans]
MPFASPRHLSDDDSAPLRRRSLALLLAVALHALILLLFFTLAPSVHLPKMERMPTTFSLTPDRKQAAEQKESGAETKKASGGAPKKPAEKLVEKPVTPKPPLPDLPFVTLSREDFAAADISKMPPRAGAGQSAGPDSGKGSAAAYGPGEGPGGEQLYDADWYRKPTHAELATYMPPGNRQTGWGLVACKTVEDYHVENCQALGESPMGSGFARAVRLAAWQFRVIPPRIGGRPQIGTWVRIRIDYIEGEIRPR